MKETNIGIYFLYFDLNGEENNKISIKFGSVLG